MNIATNYQHALDLPDRQEDDADATNDLEMYFIPNNEQEVTPLRLAFEECNMLNPDTDDSMDSDNELYTKEHFENMDTKD